MWSWWQQWNWSAPTVLCSLSANVIVSLISRTFEELINQQTLRMCLSYIQTSELVHAGITLWKYIRSELRWTPRTTGSRMTPSVINGCRCCYHRKRIWLSQPLITRSPSQRGLEHIQLRQHEVATATWNRRHCNGAPCLAIVANFDNKETFYRKELTNFSFCIIRSSE